MVDECIQYAFSNWGNSSHKLKKKKKKKHPTISTDKTNYTIAIKRRRKTNCTN